jgi:hypothetical protein
MLLTSKDDLGLGLNKLGIGILGLPASTLGLPASTLALSLELELVQSFPTSDESLPTNHKKIGNDRIDHSASSQCLLVLSKAT